MIRLNTVIELPINTGSMITQQPERTSSDRLEAMNGVYCVSSRPSSEEYGAKAASIAVP